jgi:Asp-tRNA(Asn)/Glu-tRNA(Gln) amidotransferase A subunit family amidase
MAAQVPRLITLSEWMRASRQDRKQAFQANIDHIDATDPSIHAWVQVQPQRPTGTGALAEIPFGAKDIIETLELSTEYGSPIYAGRIGTSDAAIIGELRQRGAILLGKTQTTAFAHRAPAPTRNPRNLAHTPGGSSSGSAAAVAAGMVPLALGTQTLGSVLRPASYCGVTGFKPTHGLIGMEGVLPFATSLDTLGFFTHTPADMLLLWEALGHSVDGAENCEIGAAEPAPHVEPEMVASFQLALTALRAAGVAIRPLDIAELLATLHEATMIVMAYEAAQFHEQRFNEYGSRLGVLADLVSEGLAIPVDNYDDAKRTIAECGAKAAVLFAATPVILVPAATGPAPKGLAWTGDAQMNSPWTALGTPAISIPMPVGEALPLGLQLTGAQGQDATVLRAAVRLHDILGQSQ